MPEKINAMIWGTPLITLILASGIIYTVKLGFIQLRIIPFFAKHAKGHMSGPQFRTVCMSLGAAMGTGNITGVASALSIGGAGSVFWMWVSAFLGMSTVYAENSLSAQYSDNKAVGPMAYIKRGLGSEKLALFYAFCCVLACFGMGGMVQVNTASESIAVCFNVSPFILAAVTFIIIYFTVSGGAARIASAAQLLLPVSTAVYAVLCIWVIYKYNTRLPYIFQQIIREAFGIKQAAGGFSGFTISKAVSAGIRRGVFSNEAGLGSSAILHSSAQSRSCAELQGMSSMLEVFIDTIVCCTLTALVILCASDDGTVRSALMHITGTKTDFYLAVIMTVFALCTVIGWYYCGETAFRYIFRHTDVKIFAFAFSLAASFGALFKAEKIWTISDIFNGLMAFPNIIAVLFLVKKVKKE